MELSLQDEVSGRARSQGKLVLLEAPLHRIFCCGMPRSTCFAASALSACNILWCNPVF